MPTPKFKKELTTKICNSAVYSEHGGTGKNKVVLWDALVNGLGLRLYPSGRRYWVLRYPHPNRPRRSHIMSIGEYPALTLAKARKKAMEMKSRLVIGEDPAIEKQGRVTFGDFADRYLEEYSRQRKASWKTDEYRLDKYIRPALGDYPLSGITRGAIAALHTSVGNTYPYEANRLVELIRSIIEKAKQWEVLPPAFLNPCKAIDMFPEKKRDRVLSTKEAQKLVKAATEYPESWIGPLIILYLLTGARKLELLSLRWSDVNLTDGKVLLHNKKGKREHPLWVPPMAIRALECMKEQKKAGNPYVFPRRHGPGHRKDFRKHWDKVLDAAEIANLHVHDLRRTVGTWMSEIGENIQSVQLVLDQRDSEATKHYVHLTESATRAPLERLAERLETGFNNDTGDDDGSF